MHRKDSATDTSDTPNKRLISKMNGTDDTLNIQLLGIYIGGGLHQISYALLQYRRYDRESPLRVKLLKVNAV